MGLAGGQGLSSGASSMWGCAVNHVHMNSTDTEDEWEAEDEGAEGGGMADGSANEPWA
jgi:hypothetical protein